MSTAREQIDPLVAMADVEWYRDNPPVAEDALAELLQAAETLRLAVKRTLGIEAPRLGATEYLTQNDYDSLSFYAGASFALAKVQHSLTDWDWPDS